MRNFTLIKSLTLQKYLNSEKNRKDFKNEYKQLKDKLIKEYQTKTNQLEKIKKMNKLL